VLFISIYNNINFVTVYILYLIIIIYNILLVLYRPNKYVYVYVYVNSWFDSSVFNVLYWSLVSFSNAINFKICIIEVYLLKYYFERQLIFKWSYYRQTIFNQLNIMVPYADIIGLCHSVAILWEIYVMPHKCHMMWLHLHFKRMLITGLVQ
jgi:hypothetical protein